MDFVIAWVDGNDPQWRKEFETYKDKTYQGDSSEARFRDWDNLQYWFRGVEKFAPWVDTIHFVTWGHLPDWLNTQHHKLNIVRHQDFIPDRYLPTFNTRAIELNFHRIRELKEEYVYFNDDMFLINKIKENDFFQDGKPCDSGFLSFLTGRNYDFTLLTDMFVLNRHFSKWETVKDNRSNWFNFKYGIRNLSNLFLLYAIKDRFPGFANFHLPQPSLKSTLQTLWEKENESLDWSCGHKFRKYTTVNHYLSRYWDLAANNFKPCNTSKLGEVKHLYKTDFSDTLKCIEKQKRPMLCLNDHVELAESEFRAMKEELIQAFEKILPEKSKFEK